MLRNFEEVIEQTRKLGGREVAVAAAGDREVLEAAVWQKERQRTVKQP